MAPVTASPARESAQENPHTCLLDLPDDVSAVWSLCGRKGGSRTSLVHPASSTPAVQLLGLCLSVGLEEPRHIAAACIAHPRLRAVAQQAALRLNLAAGPTERLAPAAEQQQRLKASLAGLIASFPLMRGLDLQGTVAEDADVASTLASLPCLETLVLSGCKKLTTGAVAPLAAAASSTLHLLDLQRCYQLGAGALSQLLGAARTPGARLRVLAMSHLALRDWPSEEHGMPRLVRASTAISGARTGLRALALHNCSALTPAGLLALAEACPGLEALFLGGCTILPAAGAALAPADGPAAAGAGGGAEPALLASERAAAREPSAIATAVERTASQRCAVVSALRRLVVCGRIPPSFARGYTAEVAAELAVVALLLPRLRLLELTFAAPGVAHLLRLLLREPQLAAARGVGGDSCGPGMPAPMLLDLCGSSCTEAAISWRTLGSGTDLACGDADLLLSAAANCSAGGRCTPAHAAAEEGDARRLVALLAMGAAPEARDKAGSTPLFVACEAGAVACARVLVEQACADPCARNTAGETPLYIAALRGHGAVVDLLLEACQRRGVRWTEPCLFGDGWTPLHAAAVGGHTAVGERLLDAAGAEVRGGADGGAGGRGQATAPAVLGAQALQIPPVPLELLLLLWPCP